MIDDLEKEIRQDFERFVTTLRSNLSKATPKDTGAASRAWKDNVTLDGVLIENKKPYIQRLNEGHSKQASAGWVQRTINKTLREFE